MKKIVLIVVLTLLYGIVAFGQYFLRGQVVNKYGQRLPSVKIVTSIGKQQYKSDLFGNFGFNSAFHADTLAFYFDGYDTLTSIVQAEHYAKIILKALPLSVVFTKDHFSILIQQQKSEDIEYVNREETYQQNAENNFLHTLNAPGISISANINRASYSNVRRLINEMDGLLPPYAVRIEEMLNYFNFNYTAPGKDSVFHCNSYLTNCPWNTTNQLLFVNVSAMKIDMRNIPPNNLVFLIDVSGSMDMPNKLPLLKAGFIKMVKNLRPIDTVSIITYGENVNLLLEGVSGNYKDRLTTAIEKLTASGPTPGEEGIKLAFKVADRRFIRGGNNRIILAADGDFNVGVSTEKELMALIEQQKKSGIYLTCLGVGTGNYKDSKLSVLAARGNGNFAYIDNEQEAEKVLVTDLTKTLFTVADNVYLTMHFNPLTVKAYRLIGYDNENTMVKDSMTQLKGGEIGSGHSLMAVFELIPSEAAGIINDTLLASLKVHYQLPQGLKKFTLNYKCRNTFIPLNKADRDVKKAACLVLFGLKLKDSDYSNTTGWRQLQILSKQSFDDTHFLEKEFLQLVTKAKKMYTHRKRYGGSW